MPDLRSFFYARKRIRVPAASLLSCAVQQHPTAAVDDEVGVARAG